MSHAAKKARNSVNRGENVFVIVISSLASADKGSHFYPALRVEEGRGEPHFSNNRSKEGAYADIALVDDDRNILTSLSIALEAEGCRIMTYSDGVSASGD